MMATGTMSDDSLFFSSEPKKKSWGIPGEYTIFSKALEESLQNCWAATLASDGSFQITAESLAKALDRIVPEVARRHGLEQTPLSPTEMSPWNVLYKFPTKQQVDVTIGVRPESGLAVLHRHACATP